MQTNVFEPPSKDPAYEALRREVAAYIIAETQNGTKEPHVALETGAAIIEGRLLESTLAPKIEDIFDRYKGGSGVPPSSLPAEVRTLLDERESGRYVPQERRQQRVVGTAGTAEKPRVIGTLSSRGGIGREKLEEVYDDTVLCGALWHSGLLRDVLSALGWREVDQRLRDIEAGMLMALDDRTQKIKIDSNKGTVLGQPTVSLAKRFLAGRKKTAFGASAPAAAHAEFIAHQRGSVVNAAMAVHDGTNAVGYGPSFLEAYIHGINVAAGAEAEMTKEDTAVAKFRVLAYATACALYVIVKHHVAKCAPPQAAGKKIGTGEQLAKAILGMLSKHTAIPSAKHGSFVMLLRHVNYQLNQNGHAGFALPSTAVPNDSLTHEEMVNLVGHLATFESSEKHGFGRLLVRPSTAKGTPDFEVKAKYGSLFQAYMDDYQAGANAVSGAKPSTPDDMAMVLRLVLTELTDAKVELSRDTQQLPELDTTDARGDDFSTKLEARVKRMVDSTWLLVSDVPNPQYLSVVTRARSSVLTANARKPTGKPGELVQSLNDLLDAARNATGRKNTTPHLDRDTKEKEIEYSDIVANMLDGIVPVPENTNASERSDHLNEFARAVSSKSSSLAKFVLVMRHLTLEMKRTFAATAAAAAATGAAGIHAKSKVSALDATALHKLITLGENVKYFAVASAGIVTPKLIFAAHTAAGTAAAALANHMYARLPGVFVTKTEEGGNAVLKLDALTSEETRAKLANQKKRVLAFKEDKMTLDQMHAAAEPLLGVKSDDMRGRAPADAFRGFGKGTYGVLFKDASGPPVLDCWRLFVHVTGERTERDDTRLRAIRASLYLLLKEASAQLAGAGGKLPGGVVYGDDEWGSLLVAGATISGVSTKLAKVSTLGLDDGKGSLLREKETLHVHRWPDMEFVPAPFAHATPMFWKDPTSLP
jgi:hypothetical protein